MWNSNDFNVEEMKAFKINPPKSAERVGDTFVYKWEGGVSLTLFPGGKNTLHRVGDSFDYTDYNSPPWKIREALSHNAWERDLAYTPELLEELSGYPNLIEECGKLLDVPYTVEVDVHEPYYGESEFDVNIHFNLIHHEGDSVDERVDRAEKFYEDMYNTFDSDVGQWISAS